MTVMMRESTPKKGNVICAFMLAEHRPFNPHIHHIKQLNTDIATVGH